MIASSITMSLRGTTTRSAPATVACSWCPGDHAQCLQASRRGAVLAGDLLAHAVDAGAPSAARLDVEPVHFEHSRLTCDRRQDRLLRGSEHDRAVVVGGVLDGEHLRLPIA